MSKPKHTDGPWIAYTDDRRSKEWWVASTGPGFALPVSAPGAPQDYDEANARLIAHAPSMLAALKRAERLLQARDIHEAAKELQWMIRKVEGRE